MRFEDVNVEDDASTQLAKDNPKFGDIDPVIYKSEKFVIIYICFSCFSLFSSLSLSLSLSFLFYFFIYLGVHCLDHFNFFKYIISSMFKDRYFIQLPFLGLIH